MGDVTRRALSDVLGLIDREGAPVVSPLHASTWPAGAVADLTDTHVLRHEPFHAVVHCSDCGERCWRPVVEGPEHPGPVWSILCPDGDTGCGRLILVEREQLQAWRFDAAQFPRRLGRVLGAKPACRELVHGRLWELGRAPIAGTQYRVYLARGLWWPGDVTVYETLARRPRTGQELLLTFAAAPPGVTERPAIPQVAQVPLTECLDVTDGALTIPLDGFAELRGDRTTAAAPTGAAYHLVLRPEQRVAEINGTAIVLTSVPFSVLHALAHHHLANPTAWRSVRQVAETAWGLDQPGDTRKAVIDQVSLVRDRCVKPGAVAPEDRKAFLESRRDGRYRLNPALVRVTIDDTP